MLFLDDLDLNGQYLIEKYAQYGVPSTLSLTPVKLIVIGVASIFIAPLVIPVHIAALGEEIGWRGYLLPQMLKVMSERKAFVLK